MGMQVDRPRSGTLPLGVRLFGVWFVGGLAGPALATIAFLELFARSWGGESDGSLIAVLVVVAVLAAAAFAGVEAATPLDPARRTSRAGCVGRGLVVLVLGEVGWLAAAWVNAMIGTPLQFPGLPALLLSGLPFVLVAAVLVGGRVGVVAAGLALLAVVAGSLLVGTQQALRADDALLARFAGVRELVYVVDIPSHPFVRRSDVAASFDPNVGIEGRIFQERTISLSASSGSFDCGSARLSVAFGADESPTCMQEAPGLWYLTGAIPTPEWGCPCGLQQYVRQDGATIVTVGASDAVPRETLRTAVLDARRATDDDLRRIVAAEG